MRIFFIACLMLICAGCGPLTVPADGQPKPTTETVWTVLADYVASGDVTDSSKLELIVKRLRSHGDIDDNAVDKFYAAFPGIKDKELPVTKDDASKLKGL